MIDTASLRTITPHGKFFSRKGQKFFLKAMRLEDSGSNLSFEGKVRLLGKLDELKQLHTTALVLTEQQSQSILDLATQTGLVSIVELEVEPDELIDRRKIAVAVSRVTKAASNLNGRPGLLGFLINCPISQDLLRMGGLKRVRSNLSRVIEAIRSRNESAMVAVRHRPETRALTLLEEDFIYGDVPALAPVELRDFIVSLHNLAEARPVVIEFSQASPGQDEAVAVAFGTGAAGVVAPAVASPASSDWMSARVLKASELMPFVTLNGTCPPAMAQPPMVSVVICAYNAERTMLPCLESLRKIDYPNFEVVIVDDGSRDATAQIAMNFPEFRLIRQPNKGLSVARNVGLHAARGDLIAYTDSDCVVDPHWLTLMVRTLTEKNFDGCGGPNYAPHEDGWIEACCAASPGAPCHVLTADDVAEHLAGCNMVFTKAALLKVGGFDPQFTSAGDDVDVCWRILDSGMRLGYCPGAFVWHFRRNTIKAYYGQQRGYGRAEAMLYARYPERFNILGQIKWRGMIPGLLRTVPGGSEKNVLWAPSRPGLPTVFDPTLSLARFLPQTLEWTLGWALLAMVSLALHLSLIPSIIGATALSMIALGPIWALYYAWHAPIEKTHVSFKARMLVAYLAYTGPVVRTITRYRTLANAQRNISRDNAMRQRPTTQWLKRTVRLAYWNELWTPRDELLSRLTKYFEKLGTPSIIESGWKDYDLQVRPGPFTSVEIKTADEEHEAGKLKNHVAARVKMSNLSSAAIGVGIAGAIATTALSIPILAIGLSGLTLLFTLCVAAAMVQSGRLVCRAVEECAAELNLYPLGKLIERAPAAAQRPITVSAAERVTSIDLASSPSPPAID